MSVLIVNSFTKSDTNDAVALSSCHFVINQSF